MTGTLQRADVTLIDWSSKYQPTIETITRETVIVALCTCVEHSIMGTKFALNDNVVIDFPESQDRLHNTHDLFAFRHCEAIVEKVVGFLHPPRKRSLKSSTGIFKYYQHYCLLLLAFLTWQVDSMDIVVPSPSDRVIGVMHHSRKDGE